jgi:hypothetical protein
MIAEPKGNCFLFFHKWSKWLYLDDNQQFRRCLRCGRMAYRTIKGA